MRYGSKSKKPQKKQKLAKKNQKEKVSYKDVMILLLAEGLSAVEASFKDGTFSRHNLQAAVEHLAVCMPRQSEDLAKFLAQAAPVRPHRGRVAPQTGDERDYKAQQVNDTDPYLRLPLSTLGAKKGDIVRVRFEADRLVVTRVRSEAALKKAG